MFNSFNGFKLYEVASMTVYVGEDWSRVRSPARARRRRKKHPQNITALYKPSDEILVDENTRSIYCHPAVALKLRNTIDTKSWM